ESQGPGVGEATTELLRRGSGGDGVAQRSDHLRGIVGQDPPGEPTDVVEAALVVPALVDEGGQTLDPLPDEGGEWGGRGPRRRLRLPARRRRLADQSGEHLRRGGRAHLGERLEGLVREVER